MPSSPPARIGPTKRILFSIVMVGIVLGAMELAVRAYVAYRVGPSVLWYGTDLARRDIHGTEESGALLRKLYHRRLRGAGDEHHNIRQHDNRREGYSKYRPNQARFTYDADTGEVYPVSINRHGFRGPDFEREAAPGVVRVVTLGASSTFGYNDADDQTYPAQLERILEDRCARHDYEVINLGIPHLNSDEIVALFRAEGLPLRPDVVTFYEGINDSHDAPVEDGEDEASGRSFRPGRWARDHLLLVALLNELVETQLKRYTAQEVADHMRGRGAHFVANLEVLRRLAQEHGFELIVVKQQARSLVVPRERLRGVTYREEVETVERKLAEDGSVGKKARNFLTHAVVIEAEEQWARSHDVRFVDGVAALDQDRDTLVSWVHLSHRGNALLAGAIADEVLDATCTGPALPGTTASRSDPRSR